MDSFGLSILVTAAVLTVAVGIFLVLTSARLALIEYRRRERAHRPALRRPRSGPPFEGERGV